MKKFLGFLFKNRMLVELQISKHVCFEIGTGEDNTQREFSVKLFALPPEIQYFEIFRISLWLISANLHITW